MLGKILCRFNRRQNYLSTAIIVASLLMLSCANRSVGPEQHNGVHSFTSNNEDRLYQRSAAGQVLVEPKQVWNYVNVRQDAFMFWWLYYTTASEGFQKRPLVIWLQGGPGGSSTGFGNFAEIGPLTVNLTTRPTTWVNEVSVLFIDNPVGTGYSYVVNENAYVKNNHEIAVDLVTTLSQFLKDYPEFKTIPLYIFSESYGGKMAAEFSQLLMQNIRAGSVACNFHGVALGDSWISPIDSVLTWGKYLYSTSLVDEIGLKAIDDVAQRTQDAINRGDYSGATNLWGEAENEVSSRTNGVNLYNILKWGGSESRQHTTSRHSAKKPCTDVACRTTRIYYQDDLSALMNGPIRKNLRIIPDNVTWGGQSDSVFKSLYEDFMKPVVNVVSDLLENTTVEVNVYNGQLDVIVDTLGTESWVQTMQWSGLPCYNSGSRQPFYTPNDPVNVAGFLKNCKTFSFYWILDAGHMIPSDAGDAALTMLKKIVHLT